MATKKARDAKAPSQEEKQQIEEQHPPAESNGQPQMSKADMVRQSVAAGMDNPTDGVAFVKSQFGIDLPKAMWSSYVSQQKAREGGGTPRTRSSAPAQVGIPAGFSNDVREIRGLLEKLGGADEAKDVIGQLVGLVGKYGSSGLTEIIDALG